MAEEPTTDVTETDASHGATEPAEQVDSIADDVLVEEVSIDGMCGVY